MHFKKKLQALNLQVEQPGEPQKSSFRLWKPERFLNAAQPAFSKGKYSSQERIKME